MSALKLLLLLVFIEGSRLDYVINNKRFPEDFWFGTRTSAYQVEGAWDREYRGPSIWDNTTHANPNFTVDSSNGDIACWTYFRYTHDIAYMKEMGVTHYSFSLSWSRILPTGLADNVNEWGINYYVNVLRELRENGITPIITLTYNDIPTALQELGGYQNESFPKWFEDYARVCFSWLGWENRLWITFGDPKETCIGAYGYGYYPPSIKSEGFLDYTCAHNILKAHAKAWHVYDQEFRANYSGKVSIALHSSAFLSASDTDEDKLATDTKYQFELGWFAHPVYYGDYPETMKTRIAERSQVEGRNQSRLPEFTDEEKALLKGTADFFSLNTYTANYVRAADLPVSDPPTRVGDIGVDAYQPSDWDNSTQPSWFKIAPWAVTDLLNWIKDNYEDPDILITENGLCTDDDTKRISYIRDYLSYIRDAMEDGVKVFGYFVWSLLDTFEWHLGFTQKFGLYEIDFEDDYRNREARPSAAYFTAVCTTRCLTDECVD